MLKGPKDFPECDRCINAEFDPFACETCDNASNFEPYNEGDEEDAGESIDYQDFIKIYREEFQ